MWFLNQVKGKGGAQQVGLDYREADKNSACVYSTASQKNGDGQGGFAKLVFLHCFSGLSRKTKEYIKQALPGKGPALNIKWKWGMFLCWSQKLTQSGPQT